MLLGTESGGQDHGGRFQLGYGAVGALDPYLSAWQQLPDPLERHHLAPLQQSLQAFVELVDHLALADLGGGEVNGPAVHADPVLARSLDRPVDGRRL